MAIPTTRQNTAQATRQLRVVLGPSVAKTTQQQPKTRVLQQSKLIVKTMATSHNPKTEEKPNSQRIHGKTQPTDLEISSHPTSTNPQHTQFPNVMAGELTQEEKGKEQTPSLCAREKGTAQAKHGRRKHMHSLKWKKEIRISTASKNREKTTATQIVG